jgi:hypothetical protein
LDRNQEKAMKKVIWLPCVAVFVFVVCATIAWASPPVGVTPTLIGRGTYEPFRLKTDPDSLVEFQAKAKSTSMSWFECMITRLTATPGGIHTLDRYSSLSCRVR